MTPHDLIAAFDAVAEAPDGVGRLRELVLQLSVRGRLVPQNPADEPAGVLLERIKQEASAYRSRVTIEYEQEKPADVPLNWEWVYLGDAMALFNGRAFKPTDWSDSGIPIVRIQNLNNPTASYNYCDSAVDEKFCIDSGHLLLSWSGTPGTSFGAFVWEGGRAVLNQHIFRCEPRGRAFVTHYLRLAINSRLAEMIERAHGGVGLRHITRGKLEGLWLPLPPLAEQRRIVARVGELMGLLDRLEVARTTRDGTRAAVRDSALDALREADTPDEVEAAWDRFAERMDDLLCDPADIAPLRETVLQLAVRGRLVPQDPADEPASVLLERIAADRAAAVAAKLTRMGDDPGGYDEEDSLPVGWEWTPLQDVVQFIDYRGKTPPKTANGVRLITAKNIRDGYVTDEPREFVSPKTYEDWMTRGFPKEGDVLFTTEAPMGKAALVAFSERFALAQRAINLHPYADLDSKHLMWILLSPWFQERLRKRATGMTATGIKGAKLRLIRVPMPPVDEQHRIVARVDELMSLLNRLEARLTAELNTHADFAAAAVHHLDT